MLMLALLHLVAEHINLYMEKDFSIAIAYLGNRSSLVREFERREVMKSGYLLGDSVELVDVGLSSLDRYSWPPANSEVIKVRDIATAHFNDVPSKPKIVKANFEEAKFSPAQNLSKTSQLKDLYEVANNANTYTYLSPGIIKLLKQDIASEDCGLTNEAVNRISIAHLGVSLIRMVGLVSNASYQELNTLKELTSQSVIDFRSELTLMANRVDYAEKYHLISNSEIFEIYTRDVAPQLQTLKNLYKSNSYRNNFESEWLGNPIPGLELIGAGMLGAIAHLPIWGYIVPFGALGLGHALKAGWNKHETESELLSEQLTFLYQLQSFECKPPEE